jgi:hypothetical protein
MWESSSWTGEMWLFFIEMQPEALGFCVLWANRASGATCRVAGYLFPLIGESGVLAFWWGSKGWLSCCQGQCWASKLSGEWSLLVSKIAKPEIWGSLGCVMAGSWHWVASWGYPWGSRGRELESSGVLNAVVALGSTCIGLWASRNHSSCCRHRSPKSVGSTSSEAC